jgi:ribonucleoside-diphosphate reductase alpha chain
MKHFTGINRHMQVVQAFDKYSRYRHDLNRRETWPETCQRVIDFARKHCENKGLKVTPSEWAELHDGMLEMRASPSMRVVQMAGASLERCHVGVYNCAFQFIDGPRAMAEQLYILMQGSGAGFSVEGEHAVDKWPRVKKQTGEKDETFVVPDTTEGWCDALFAGVTTWLNGRDIDYDFSGVREKGTLLKTKGGTASGPGPLKEVLNFCRQKILSRQGRRLTAIDLHDMTCYTHRIVQMGGVRRASGISLSDLHDAEMRGCKSGAFFNTHPWRNQANNSAVYDEKPSAVEFMEEWLALAKSGSGERGIFNRGEVRNQMPQRRKLGDYVFGTNPCGEIILRPHEFCNLSIGIMKHGYDLKDLFHSIRLATIWGTIQSTMTDFGYLRPEWKQNCEEERLLGVDILGYIDCPYLQPGASDRAGLLKELCAHAVQINGEWAKRFGISGAAAVTCLKPAGNSSTLFDTENKPHQSKYWIRRMRIESESPVAKVLQDHGVPNTPDYDGSGLDVFDFPCMAPGDDPIVISDMSAIDQLENWKEIKTCYTEHNPSVSIYVRDEEWLTVGQWVYANWEIVGGLSFFPYDDNVYPLAPFETIDKAEYEKRMAAFPDIDWSKLVRYEKTDKTKLALDYACVGGSCAMP